MPGAPHAPRPWSARRRRRSPRWLTGRAVPGPAGARRSRRGAGSLAAVSVASICAADVVGHHVLPAARPAIRLLLPGCAAAGRSAEGAGVAGWVLPCGGGAGDGEVGQGARGAQPVAQPGADGPAGFGLAVLACVAVALGCVQERFFGFLVGPGGGVLGAGGGAGRAEQGSGLQPGGVGGGVPAAGLRGWPGPPRCGSSPRARTWRRGRRCPGGTGTRGRAGRGCGAGGVHAVT